MLCFSHLSGVIHSDSIKPIVFGPSDVTATGPSDVTTNRQLRRRVVHIHHVDSEESRRRVAAEVGAFVVRGSEGVVNRYGPCGGTAVSVGDMFGRRKGGGGEVVQFQSTKCIDFSCSSAHV